MTLTVPNGEMNYFIVSGGENEVGDATVQLTFADLDIAEDVWRSGFDRGVASIGDLKKAGPHLFVDVDLDQLESMLMAAANAVPGNITITNKCPCCGRMELEPQLVEATS